MQQGLNVLLIGLVLIIPITSLLLIMGALFPKLTQKSQELIEVNQGRAFLIGLVNTIFLAALIFLTIFLVNNVGFPQPIIIFGVISIATFLFGTSIGLASIVNILGVRIFPDMNLPARNIWTSIILILALLTPIIGQFMIFPYTAMVGFGGIITAVFQNLRRGKST